MVFTLAACGGAAETVAPEPSEPTATPPVGPPPSGGSTPGATTGTFRMRVDGQLLSFAADEQLVFTASSGRIQLSGLHQPTQESLSLVIDFVRDTGTYPLGVAAGVVGGLAIMGRQGESMSTMFTGRAGSVHITTLTATRIAGTFSFDLGKFDPADTRVWRVTDGEFDVTLPAPRPTAHPDSARGSVVRGLVDSMFFNAASITATTGRFTLSGQADVVRILASDERWELSLMLDGITAPGTYGFVFDGRGTQRYARVQPRSASPGTHGTTWSGLAQGHIVVTEFSARRVSGHVVAQLDRQGSAPGFMPINVSFVVDVR